IRDFHVTGVQTCALRSAAVAQIMDDEGLASFQMNVVGDRSGLGRESRLKQDNKTSSATAGFNWSLARDGLLQGWQVDGYAQYGKIGRASCRERVWEAAD